ncbi:MAG TPA: c-type cytochrome biogenesis protein CcsB, partial [Ottowia sp.]|nr:c-type cytochrome biogenesis protein CcsB [Ottowia sp.]
MNTTTAPANQGATLTLGDSFLARRTWGDWLFALLVVVGAVFAFQKYHAAMDVYEKGILIGTVPVMIWLGWFWRPLRTLMLVVAALSLLAIWLYGGGDLRRADSVFLLKYFLSSQSAILWMSMLFFMSTAFYWGGMAIRGQQDALEGLGSKIAWVAVGLALIGTMVRWYESHQIGPDIGH